MKFCIGVGVTDVITRASFGDDRFRGLGEAGVELPTLPLTYAVVLKHSGASV